jgi:hypothetical protein
MTTTRYLEFDSTYRNRNQYPNPSNFLIEISQTGQKNRDNALDPVSLSSPILFWNTSFDESIASLIVNITGINFTNSTSDSNIFLILGAQNTFRKPINYYNGCVLQLTDTVTTTRIFTRIISYKLISSDITGDIAQVSVLNSLPSGFPSTVAVTGVIENPSENTLTNLIPRVFIPSGVNGDNFYINYHIYNINTGEYKKIIEYNGTTNMATLDSNTNTNWADPDINLAIRKTLIANRGTIVASGTSPNVLQLENSISSQTETYNRSYIRIITPLPTAPNFSINQPCYSQESKIIKYIGGDGYFTQYSGVNFTLSDGSIIDDFYKDCFITNNTAGITRRIVSYNGNTKSGVVDIAWGVGNVGDSWSIRSCFMDNTFTGVITNTDMYELETYTKDNANPFSYNGTLVSSQEMVCYEVELINLILPNTTLKSGRGGRAIFYPYLYVELQQVSSAGGGIKGIINSNNPNSYKMLFRAVVDDNSQPSSSPFIKIDSDSMTHTIKFKPNDSFIFAVYLPGGDLFETVQTDFYSPKQPNPLVQISACFSFKKV